MSVWRGNHMKREKNIYIEREKNLVKYKEKNYERRYDINDEYKKVNNKS